MLCETRSDPRPVVREIIEQIRQAVNKPQRLEQLTDRLETLTMAYLAPAMEYALPTVKMTAQERRFLARLLYEPGRVVTHDQMMDALYFDKTREGCPKIVQVLACKVRRRLVGTPWRIETDWAVGYRAVSRDE